MNYGNGMTQIYKTMHNDNIYFKFKPERRSESDIHKLKCKQEKDRYPSNKTI